MLKFAVWFLGALFLSFPASAESFIAKVNRNPVPLGETFVLTLQYDGNPGTNEPDLAPLNKDFTVYSVSREQQRHSINGQTSHIYRWNVAMAPKVPGTAVIPAITFRSLSSHPIKIKVADEASGSGVPRFSIGRFVSEPSPLVQEQMIYTLVIKTTEEIQGSMPQFADGGSDWIVKQLDEPTVTSEIENGIEVRKIEIRYAMFPQKSGRLTVPELRFSGYYIDKNKLRGDPFGGMFNAFMDDGFASGFGVTPGMSRVNLAAQPLEVNVRPIPEVNNGFWWLPSARIEIGSDWDKAMPVFKAGEAVNRKITLSAAGVADTQLPKLSFGEIPGVRQYPEKPQISSVATENGIVSSMEMNVVYIPEHGGRITFPEIAVPWYNVKTQKMEKAVLPSVTVSVEGAAAPRSAPAEPQKALPSVENSAAAAADKTPVEKAGSLPLKAAAAFAALAFAAGLGIGWIVLRSRCTAVRQPSVSGAKTEKTSPADIKTALRGGNLKDVRNQVLVWARSLHPEAVVLNLDDVSELFENDELSAVLKQLGQALYSGRKDAFDAARLEKVVTALSASKKDDGKQTPLLPELYK